MSETLRTALNPEPQSLWPFALVSVAFHGIGIGTFWGATAFVALFSSLVPMCAEPEKPLEFVEISMVSLPKSKTSVPDRAERAKRAAGTEAAKPELPPPVETSDVKFKTEVPDPKPGNTAETSRQQMLDEIERQRLLEEMMNAPEGEEDRRQTDPDGVEDAALAATGVAAKGDPEMARWVAKVQALLMQHFHPIATRPELVTLIKIRLDPETGEILGQEVVDESGVFAFDQAAQRAVTDLGALPLPPAKYGPLLAKEGLAFKFVPP